jgi:excisionase family DNA binding protein
MLTADELAQALKCSKAAVRAWTRQGMPSEPCGRLRRFLLDDVRAWLRKREQLRLTARNQNAEEGGTAVEDRLRDVVNE